MFQKNIASPTLFLRKHIPKSLQNRHNHWDFPLGYSQASFQQIAQDTCFLHRKKRTSLIIALVCLLMAGDPDGLYLETKRCAPTFGAEIVGFRPMPWRGRS